MTFTLQMDMVPATNFGFVAASAPAANNVYWKTGLNK
jgi:hypothetical protein